MKICIFLTTRYNSTRLPGKAFLEINGQTVTDILIGRLKKCGLPIIMCCPNTPDDHKYMKPISERNGIGFFAGEKENIIKRHSDCAKLAEVDWIINVDGDDILTCPNVINDLVPYIKMLGQAISVITTDGLPLGLNILTYKASTLESIQYDSDTNWGAQIKRIPHMVVPYIKDKEFRLTLDYAEDFEVIKDVLLNCPDNETAHGIYQYLYSHPEIAGLNHGRNEEYFKRLEEMSK